jgi:signal transduction histidine kinase
MSPFQRHRWFLLAAAVTAVFAIVSLTVHKSFPLAVFADLAVLVVMLAAAAITLHNSIVRPLQERSFWALMSIGFTLWATNQAGWTVWETLLRRPIPDPFFFDIVLFFHLIPMIAAVAWRPDLTKKQRSVHLSALNFFMLLGWWVFLYAFIVFPHQYVLLDHVLYNRYYDLLYGFENVLFIGVLAVASSASSGGWRRFYLHLFAPACLYAVNSQLLNRAAAAQTYYSGCPYDIPLIATVCWMAAASLSARDWNLSSVEPSQRTPWKKLLPRLSMLTILSLPVLGLWTVFADSSSASSRVFRLFTVLTAMLVLGAFVFLRQYVQDQAIVGLLRESRRGYESQRRLQNQLVQKEKLQSLGTLVAGAAHEINHPLTAILATADQLWAKEGLTDDQKNLLRKIVAQAQRTRDLVARLLNFAQRSPSEKSLVDVGMLLHRAHAMLEPRYPAGKIHVEIALEASLPRVSGNVNQLFQVFIEIIENAMDALQEVGGGTLLISAYRHADELILQFSDTGPGLREPQRVFDPFYTTKPVGKGTGLGLSAVFGLVQDHGGHVTCQNKGDGGALFTIRLPIAAEPAAQVATTSGD